MPIKRNLRLISDPELEVLLASYEAGTSVKEKSLQFDDFTALELEHILPDAFEGHPEFTPRQSRRMLREALRACRMRGSLTTKGLVEEAIAISRAKLSERPEGYSLWMKFRARQMAFSESFHIEWDDVVLESAYQLPSYMVKGRYFFDGYGDIEPDKPKSYGHLIARCEARTEDNAVEKMLDAIELFMALFNMHERLGLWSFRLERWPEGKLWNGPYFFVFRGETFLGDQHIWYEPNFSEPDWDVAPLDMASVLLKMPRVSQSLIQLGNHPLRDLLVSVLRLIQNAMSARDPSYRLLRYWTALERLYTEPGRRSAKQSDVIRRASFAEHNRTIAQWKLGHISRLRNEYVHAGGNKDDLWLTSYISDLLARHINHLLNRSDIRDHRQWLEFVDLPADEGKLKSLKLLVEERITLTRQMSEEVQKENQ